MLITRHINLTGDRKGAVTELTVSDVRRLIELGGEVTPETVMQVAPFALRLNGIHGIPTEDDLVGLWAEFQELNSELFRSSKSGHGGEMSPIRIKKVGQEMDETCLRLIETGHSGIWEYPYRLYKAACEMKR